METPPQFHDLGAGCFLFQELERSWREYDRLGAEVTLAKSSLLEQLEALGSPQVRNAYRARLHVVTDRLSKIAWCVSVPTDSERSYSSHCVSSQLRLNLVCNQHARS